MRRTHINTKPVADHYTGGAERIVEFSDGRGNGNGGLISFHQEDDGSLAVHVYRHGPNVTVSVGKSEHTPAIAALITAARKAEHWFSALFEEGVAAEKLSRNGPADHDLNELRRALEGIKGESAPTPTEKSAPTCNQNRPVLVAKAGAEERGQSQYVSYQGRWDHYAQAKRFKSETIAREVMESLGFAPSDYVILPAQPSAEAQQCQSAVGKECLEKSPWF